MALVRTYKELRVWQMAMDLAMRIFELTRAFPPEERYSMTDQIRRSSRSTAACIAEAWRKRRYKAAFISKLNDSEAEGAETQNWVEFARRCRYLSDATAAELDRGYDDVLAQLVAMVNDAAHWCLPPVTRTGR